MKKTKQSRRPLTWIPTLLAAAGIAVSQAAFAGGHTGGDQTDHDSEASAAMEGMDHSQHQGEAAKTMDHSGHSGHAGHAGHSTEPDELGRRLWGMEHTMPPELYDELREKVPLFARFSNAEIDLSMQQMGPEYSWYISPPELRGTQGVLVLSHGFRERGDLIFRDSIQSYANIFPMAMAPGMSMMMNDNIQLALDDLRAAGVKDVVVVPVLSSSNNELMRQWEYVLGKRDEAEIATVGQVNTEGLNIIWGRAADDDPMVAEILTDWALEISENPSKEFVMVLAHGASGMQADKDNIEERRVLNTLARYVVEDGGFAAGTGMLLQDDAPMEIRKQNVDAMRKLVAEANARGQQVLIVTNLLGSRTIQAKMRQDLKDLEYRINAKGLTQHENFPVWMGEVIREGFEKAAMPGSAAIN